jgi:uncharacterized protein
MPQVSCDQKRCMYCGGCVAACSKDAVAVYPDKVVIFHDRCNGCGNCVTVCPVGAMLKS